MSKTTRPKVRVGEWVECWLFGSDPRRGRVRGLVTSVSSYRRVIHVLSDKGRPGHMFRMFIAKDSPYAGTSPSIFYDTEIIRRLTFGEIVAAKLGGFVEDDGVNCGF